MIGALPVIRLFVYPVSVQDYRSLKVWQSAHRLAVDLYDVTSRFPPTERFGLAAHIRKTAGSISFNIAEGFGRESHADLARFLQYAKGSANELEAQLLLARDTRIAGSEVEGLLELVSEVRRMLVGLTREVRRQAR